MSPLITKLHEASRADLSAYWQKHHGSEVPKGFSQALLKLSAAYHLQARRSHGKASRIDKALTGMKSTPAKAMEPGSLLVREWHGMTFKVEVLEKGFLMNGQTFKSLSQIARHITGTRWSGPRFFGLGDTT